MSNMENYNYWNDSRTIAGMVPKPKIQTTANGTHILFETEGDDGVITVHWLKTRWEVCGTCDGEGRHVNPSIDASGITDTEWAEWEPDDRMMYTSGAYDQTCNECKGKRVVPVVDETDPMAKAYDKFRQECWDDARESAAERAMGA